MSKRLDEINFLISKTKNCDNKVNNIEEIVKEKFPEIDSYMYMEDPNKIHPGAIIRYVDIKMTKVSVWGIVTSKIFYERINGTKPLVKQISMFNNGLEIFWKISPIRYYIFQSIGIKNGLADDFIKDILDKNGNFKDKLKIKTAIKNKTILKLDEDDDFLFDQIKMYKDNLKKEKNKID